MVDDSLDEKTIGARKCEAPNENNIVLTTEAPSLKAQESSQQVSPELYPLESVSSDTPTTPPEPNSLPFTSSLPPLLPPLPPSLENPMLAITAGSKYHGFQNRLSSNTIPANTIDLATYQQLQQQRQPPLISDCLSCRLLGGFVPLSIAAYVFHVASQSKTRTEKFGFCLLGGMLATVGGLRLGNFKLDDF